MKVFISWSGTPSKQVAELLSIWIGDVLQGIKTWISTDDIDKGSIWFGDITTELNETAVGILCLTQENINSPWILFEAGALSKGLNKNRVCPLLVNLSPTDLKAPLSQFNATLPIKDDMFKLIKTINSHLKEGRLVEDRLKKSFERCWQEFEDGFTTILVSQKSAKKAPARSIENMLEEILELSRATQKSLQGQKLIKTTEKLSLQNSSGEFMNLTEYIKSLANLEPSNTSYTNLIPISKASA